MALQRWTRALRVAGKGLGGLRWLSSQQCAVDVEDERVQELLRRMCGMDLDAVFAPRKEQLTPPHYKLVTRDQLKQVHDEVMSEARQLLKMTPVLPEREWRGHTISNDEQLEGYLEHPMIFTDISTDKEKNERRMVVREPSGVLREATWEERDRMMEVYFPSLGGKMWLPAMLTAQGLIPMLEAERYQEVLDMACVQCEPDSADYIRVHHAVYDSIEGQGSYNSLRSTHHFGGLVWYLIQRERVTGLLGDMVQQKLWSDGEALVQLYLLCHPQSSLATSGECVAGKGLVEAYCHHFSLGELLSQLPSPTEPDQALAS